MTTKIANELARPYNLTDEAISFYRKNAFIKLKHVLSAEAITHFDRIITEQVIAHNTQGKPIEERDTYGKAFLQVMNLWTHSDAVKDLVFSPRLARIAAHLMEVNSVRLYHDQALYKEAGGGYTPWHADQYYWPVDSPNTVTAWIPLQETSLEMGALEFSAGSHQLNIGRDKPISDESEALINIALEKSSCKHVVEPFDLGEVSFHAGWSFHRAAPNSSDSPRRVMCIIYLDEQARLKQPGNPNQQLDWDTWCPGVRVGELIDSELNPVIAF